MSWEFATTTTQKARKEHDCQASDWINNSNLNEIDFEKEDWAIIKQAESEKWKIKKGTTYIKTTGMWEGEFAQFKARIDLDIICSKYYLYQE